MNSLVLLRNASVSREIVLYGRSRYLDISCLRELLAEVFNDH